MGEEPQIKNPTYVQFNFDKEQGWGGGSRELVVFQQIDTYTK